MNSMGYCWHVVRVELGQLLDLDLLPRHAWSFVGADEQLVLLVADWN